MSRVFGALAGGSRSDQGPSLEGRRLFLTGATGFLGSHFTLRALEAGASVEALVRADTVSDGRQRVMQALETAAATYTSPFEIEQAVRRLSICLGDISLEGCNASAQSVRRDGLSSFIHFASSLNFEERNRAQIFSTNVDGARNALKLAKLLGAARFVYVSTAYTAGVMEGTVPEELHVNVTRFNNCYEESKHAAESMVVSLGKELDIDVRIVRPSVVVGPIETKRSGGSRSGLYGFLHEIYRMREALRHVGRPVRLRGYSEMPLNFIPVDWVVKEIIELEKEGFANGPIFHLTSSSEPRLERSLEVLADLLRLPGFELSESEQDEDAPLERLLNRRILFYSSYFRGPKTFVRRRPALGGIGLSDTRAYVRGFYRELAGDAGTSVFERKTLKSFDNFPLVTFRSLKSSVRDLALVNAYGMPIDLLVGLTKKLSKYFRVTTWESRGCPSLAGELRPDQCRTATHARDMQAILNANNVDRVDLVGWCTGASVALRFAEMYPERVKTLTLLAGGFPLRDVECTWVQETVRMMAPKIAASESAAQFYHKTMFSGAKDGDEDEARFSGVLGEVDPSVVHLVSLAFRNPVALHRYSLLIGEFFAEHNERIIPPLAVKTLVMVGDADRVAHPAASAKVQGALPNSRLEILPGGDHYSVIFDDYVAESILKFTGVLSKARGSQERDGDVSKSEVLPQNRTVT